MNTKKSEGDCNLFNELIKTKLKNKDYKFTGYIFPNKIEFDNFDGFTYFMDATFEEDAGFGNATFKKGADFMDATFEKDADFMDATFKKGADFMDATFEEDAGFGNATFEGIADFGSATFKKDAYFGNATFEEDAGFGNATFEEDADFGNATFEEDAVFINATFEGIAYFINTTFQALVFAKDVKFKNKLYCEFFYRAAKNACHISGNYREEGDYHWLEMDAIRKQQGKRGRNFNLVFQKLLHGYGERPLNVLLSALTIILIFSVLFTALGIREQNYLQPVHNFWTCLYFSVITFTTLGYGDFHPVGFVRIVSAVEAVTGVFLMALFVVTFARKWRR